MFSFKPKVRFQTTVATGQNEYYDIQVPDIKFYDGSAEIQCFKTSEGEYRYILDSDKTITWTYEYNGIVYEGSKALSSVSEGTKYSVIEYHNIGVYNETKARVGDFYCCSSDNNTGYILPKEYNLASSNTHTCIGIVFHVGTGNGDDNTNYPEPILSNGIRGYVVALNDADNNGCQWSSENVDATSNDKQLWNGYVNTKAIETKLASYPAFKACVEYATSASQDCSGWYLPSKAQLEEVYIQGSILKELINKSGLDASWLDEASWYWNSTQYDSEKAEMLQNGGGTAWTKQFEAKVRPILTF